MTKEFALEAMEMSPFNIEQGVKELEMIYSRAIPRDATRPLTRPGVAKQELLPVGDA